MSTFQKVALVDVGVTRGYKCIQDWKSSRADLRKRTLQNLHLLTNRMNYMQEIADRRGNES